LHALLSRCFLAGEFKLFSKPSGSAFFTNSSRLEEFYMILISQLSKRLRFILIVIAINLIILSGLRVAFWIVFHSTANPISFEILLKSFYIGFKFDLRLSLLLVFSIPILSWIPILNPAYSSRGRHFWAGHFAILTSLIILFYFIDFAHYAYLGERVNASALRYLQNPVISFLMVWETYPIVWGISILANGKKYL